MDSGAAPGVEWHVRQSCAAILIGRATKRIGPWGDACRDDKVLRFAASEAFDDRFFLRRGAVGRIGRIERRFLVAIARKGFAEVALRARRREGRDGMRQEPGSASAQVAVLQRTWRSSGSKRPSATSQPATWEAWADKYSVFRFDPGCVRTRRCGNGRYFSRAPGSNGVKPIFPRDLLLVLQIGGRGVLAYSSRSLEISPIVGSANRHGSVRFCSRKAGTADAGGAGVNPIVRGKSTGRPPITAE